MIKPVYVDGDETARAMRGGTKLGSSTPSSETKWSYYEVYAYNGKIVVCVMSGGEWNECVCGEEITADMLDQYVNEPDTAVEIFEKLSK